MGVTRRDIVLGAGALASGLILGDPLTQAFAGETPAPGLKVMVAGGHPGDPEYGCGGTIALLTNLGHEVVLIYLNDGAWPPASAATRIAEAKKACELLKARPLYAGQVNGHAVVDNAHYEEYAKLINAENPDVILTQWPIDNHRDHRAITMLSYDAWRQSKRNSPCTTTRFLMGRIPSNSPPRTMSTSAGPNRLNAPPVMPTPARRLTGTTRCRIRWPLFAG